MSDGVWSMSSYTKMATPDFLGSNQQCSNSSNNFGSEEYSAFHSGDETMSFIREVTDRSST